MIIKKNIALEINSSSARRKGLDSFPSTEKLELYKKLGGSKVTIWSDAHRINEIYDSIDTIDQNYNFNKWKVRSNEKKKSFYGIILCILTLTLTVGCMNNLKKTTSKSNTNSKTVEKEEVKGNCKIEECINQIEKQIL